jgi:hypothetical protein
VEGIVEPILFFRRGISEEGVVRGSRVGIPLNEDVPVPIEVRGAVSGVCGSSATLLAVVGVGFGILVFLSVITTEKVSPA